MMSGSESITIARTAAITAAVMSLLTTFGAFLLLCMSENLLYRLDRVRHRRPHPVRKFHAGAQVGGLARHDQAAAWVAAQRGEHREDRVGRQVVRVHDGHARDELRRVDLEHGDRTWFIPALGGVDEHEQVAPVEQFIDQVNAADAEIGDLHAVRQRTLCQQPHYLDAEGVVALKDVADPGDQRPARQHGSTSSGAKYRNLPWADRMSAAGSSARETAR